MRNGPALLALLLTLGVLAVLLGGRAAVAPKRQTAIDGFVQNDAGPVAGAVVRWKAAATSVTTGPDGRFHLPSRRTGRLTASAPGHFIAGGLPIDGRLSLRLTPVPTEDHEDYAWVDPTPGVATPHACGDCHREIYREWAGSAHGRSAVGRHFLNLYEGSDAAGRADVGWSLLRDKPDGSGVCNACHVPTMPFDGERYFDVRNARGAAAQGVHCDYCHKIEDVAGGVFGLAHGRFNLKLLRPAEGQLFFGPLDDVDRGEDVHSPFSRDSRYCASCHEGVVFGVAVYTTYSEWLDSPAARQGQSCQSCHMKPTGRMTNIAPGRGGVERSPATLGNHVFFDGSRAEMLRRAVKLTATARRDGAVRVEVEVRADDVGHRVPTGFIDRHLVLSVEAFDREGQSVAATEGPRLPSAAGVDGVGRLYAKLLHDEDGRSPAPFWRCDPEPVDTRLEPGRVDRSCYAFGDEVVRVKVRLVHRKFWRAVSEAKGWTDEETIVAETAITP